MNSQNQLTHLHYVINHVESVCFNNVLKEHGIHFKGLVKELEHSLNVMHGSLSVVKGFEVIQINIET